MVTSSLQKANKRNQKASSNHTRSVINRAATLLCSGACSSCDRNTENVLELGHNEKHKLRWKPSARLREEAGAMECVQERQSYQSQGDRLKQSPHLFLMVSVSKNTLTVSISHMRPMETKVAQCGQSQPASMWERQSIWRSYWCTLPCSAMSKHLRSWVPEYQSAGSISVVLFTTSSREHPSPNHSAEKANTQHESLRGQRKSSQFRSQSSPLWMTFLSGLFVCLGLLMWFEFPSP